MAKSTTSSKLRALTGEEHAALARFARIWGRTWKRELATQWERGGSIPSVLARLKSTLGPSELDRYRLWMAAWAPLPGGDPLTGSDRGPGRDAPDVEAGLCDFCNDETTVAVSEQAVTIGSRICAACARWALDALAKAEAAPELPAAAEVA